MGRKRKVPVVGEVKQSKTRTGNKLSVDSSILAAFDAVAEKHSRVDKVAGNPAVLNRVLPVPSLALRYLLQNEGLPLGLVYHLVGLPASFKSTLGVEFGRWHRECGGAISVCGAEDKDTPDLRNSILDWDNTGVYYRECEYIEVWQESIMNFVKAMRKNVTGNEDFIPPVAFIVDSYMGKMPKRLYESTVKSGFATKHFGEAAALIGDWLSVYSSFVRGLPCTLIGINHLKEAIDPGTFMKQYRTPGGQMLKHQNVTEIQVFRIKNEQKEIDGIPYHLNRLSLKTTKNSRGAQNKRIQVVLRQYNEPDPDGEGIRLVSVFEWLEATVELLYDGTGMSAAEQKILMPRIKEIVNVQKLSNASRYWCPELGIAKSDALPGYDMGLLIESNNEILYPLYDVLGIVRRPIFNNNLPYAQQLQEDVPDETEIDSVDEEVELDA